MDATINNTKPVFLNKVKLESLDSADDIGVIDEKVLNQHNSNLPTNQEPE